MAGENSVRVSSTRSLRKNTRGDSPTGNARLTHVQGGPKTPLLHRIVPTIFDPHLHTSDTTRSAWDTFLRVARGGVAGNYIRVMVDEFDISTRGEMVLPLSELCEDVNALGQSSKRYGQWYAHLHAVHASSVSVVIVGSGYSQGDCARVTNLDGQRPPSGLAGNVCGSSPGRTQTL